jgi:hypothetical protein
MTSGSDLEIIAAPPGPEPSGSQPCSSLLRVHGLGFWRPMPLLAGRHAVTRLTVCDPWARSARSCRTAASDQPSESPDRGLAAALLRDGPHGRSRTPGRAVGRCAAG